MGLLMIYVAYMPIYKKSRFLARTSEQVQQRFIAQEVIADLKIFGLPNSQDLLDNPGTHLQPSPSAFTV